MILPNISFLSRAKCELSEYTDSAHTEVDDLSSRYMMGQMCTTDADTTQNNFILSALPVGGLTSQNATYSRLHHSNHLAK